MADLRDDAVDRAVEYALRSKFEVFLSPGQQLVVHWRAGTGEEYVEHLYDRGANHVENLRAELEEAREGRNRAESKLIAASHNPDVVVDETIRSLHEQIEKLGIENHNLRSELERKTFR